MFHVFIINPKAGKGKDAKKLVTGIVNYFKQHGGQYKILNTQKEGDATAFARRICAEYDAVNVYACGGDGTTYEVLNGIFGCENANLGIIPCGSGNDFVKYFESRAPFLDLEDQLHGEAVPMDVIRMGERVAINSCSVGMDAMVADHVRYFKKLPISASVAYILSCVYTAFKKFNNDLKIQIDGHNFGKIPCLFAVCANAPFYGGGFKCAPTACPGDGKLEYSVIECKSKLQVLKILGRYRKGTHITLPNCRYGNCSTMEITSNRPMVVNLDGEITHSSQVKFELLKGAVHFILPRSLAAVYRSRFANEREAVAVN